MEKGKLYGVGVGPGDPELITIKAVRLLKEADVVAVPDNGSGKNTALEIVKTYVEGKHLIYCPIPMIHDKTKLKLKYEEISNNICTLLDKGKNITFITLGDPTIYSTYYYIHRIVVSRGYEATLIPGVTSFCAAAARLGTSLCEHSERLLIVPANNDLKDTMSFNANKVFMKAGSGITKLQEQLSEAGQLENASMVENCGMENERVWQNFSDMNENSGYFSLVVVKVHN